MNSSLSKMSGRNLFSTISFWALAAFLTIGLGAACAKKKKDDVNEAPPAAAGAEDTKITDKELTFDPQGSDSGKISGLKTIYFPYDQSALSSESRKTLQSNADWIKANENYSVQVEGHCDQRGSIEYNLALGERRAKSVRAYLVSLGVPGNRLSIISYGKEKPLVQGDEDSAMSKKSKSQFYADSKVIICSC